MDERLWGTVYDDFRNQGLGDLEAAERHSRDVVDHWDIREDVEIKARVVGDQRKWEDIPVNETLPEPHGGIHGYCLTILKAFPGVTEVRWNWKGSLQGHYVNRNFLED